MALERERITPTDAEIDTDVRETLRWDMRVDDANVDIAVSTGRVRLIGRVGTLAEKLAAGDDAARIKGVVNVSNELVVAPQILRRDEDMARDVEGALQRDRRVSDQQIAVDVQNGIVRLTGTVRTLAQKRAAAEDAWYTAGVVDLADELRVVPLHRRSDAAIVADVRTALALNGHILAPDTH